MKKRLLVVLAVSVAVMASPVFAHDHASMEQGASNRQTDEQQAKEEGQQEKEGQALLDSCAQQIAKLHRRISTLQEDLAGKKASASVREELKKVEQTLKEANHALRALQIF